MCERLYKPLYLHNLDKSQFARGQFLNFYTLIIFMI